MSKTIIIGGSFAGLSCALQAKQLYPDMEVQVFDSQETVGFIPSGMNLVLNHEVDQLEAASFISEKEVRAAGVQLYLGHQVVEVDMKAKWLRVKDLKTQVITDYPYDQLVLAMGSKQIGHLVAHLDHPAIISTKDIGSAHHALEVLEDAGHVVVVGGGQIGIEACEALVNANKQVTLIEANDSLAERYFDADFVEEIEAAIEIVGVDLRVGQKVTAVETEPLRVILEDGDEIYADAILMGVNLFPNSSLVADQVELNSDKTIWTSPYLETSVTDVFAVGDLVQVPYADQGRDFIALVNNAIRSGQIAAFNLKENRVKQATSLRVIGSRIFSQYVVSVAKTEHEANGTSAQP
ncbi:MAG: FAD-dependent oxidoreductase, partial [Abiotrophia defectiva]|nr:FAD-dependent oxidoreductase [Abiotrophia defectiva]